MWEYLASNLLVPLSLNILAALLLPSLKAWFDPVSRWVRRSILASYVVIIVVMTIWTSQRPQCGTPTVIVPRFIDRNISEANVMATKYLIKLVPIKGRCTEYDDIVLEQSLRPGDQVSPKTSVTVCISQKCDNRLLNCPSRP